MSGCLRSPLCVSSISHNYQDAKFVVVRYRCNELDQTRKHGILVWRSAHCSYRGQSCLHLLEGLRWFEVMLPFPSCRTDWDMGKSRVALKRPEGGMEEEDAKFKPRIETFEKDQC